MTYVTIVLVLALVFVNGFTDAPTAIATAVSTHAISVRRAIALSALMNFLGMLAGTVFAPRLLTSVVGIADGLTPAHAAAATAAAMASCILFAVAASVFGIPTSESHGMLAGAIGASCAYLGVDALVSEGAKAAVFGLFFALAAGVGCGVLFAKILHTVCEKAEQKRLQTLARFGAGMSAFLHGAQDGQKFLGMFLLCGVAQTPQTAFLPIALTLTIGTALGGRRILTRLSELVPLSVSDGLAAEGGSIAVVLFATLAGIPVSTTHAKTATMVGAGAAKGRRAIRVRSAFWMVLSWILTFPVCGALGFGFVRLFFAQI